MLTRGIVVRQAAGDDLHRPDAPVLGQRLPGPVEYATARRFQALKSVDILLGVALERVAFRDLHLPELAAQRQEGDANRAARHEDAPGDNRIDRLALLAPPPLARLGQLHPALPAKHGPAFVMRDA